MPIESMTAGKMNGPAKGTLALITTSKPPESGGSRGCLFMSDVEQSRTQLAMGEQPFTAAVRFRTDANGTLFANTKPEGQWIRDGKSLFIDGGGRLTYDIGWLGAINYGVIVANDVDAMLLNGRG